MGYVRVREPGKHAFRHPEHGGHVTPRADELFDESDPLVKANRWAFATDAEFAKQRDEERASHAEAMQVVEQASAVPGEKRPARRR